MSNVNYNENDYNKILILFLIGSILILWGIRLLSKRKKLSYKIITALAVFILFYLFFAYLPLPINIGIDSLPINILPTNIESNALTNDKAWEICEKRCDSSLHGIIPHSKYNFVECFCSESRWWFVDSRTQKDLDLNQVQLRTNEYGFMENMITSLDKNELKKSEIQGIPNCDEITDSSITCIV